MGERTGVVEEGAYGGGGGVGVAVLGPGKGSNGGFPALRGSADTSCDVTVGEPGAWGGWVELSADGF